MRKFVKVLLLIIGIFLVGTKGAWSSVLERAKAVGSTEGEYTETFGQWMQGEVSGTELLKKKVQADMAKIKLVGEGAGQLIKWEVGLVRKGVKSLFGEAAEEGITPGGGAPVERDVDSGGDRGTTVLWTAPSESEFAKTELVQQADGTVLWRSLEKPSNTMNFGNGTMAQQMSSYDWKNATDADLRMWGNFLVDMNRRPENWDDSVHVYRNNDQVIVQQETENSVFRKTYKDGNLVLTEYYTNDSTGQEAGDATAPVASADTSASADVFAKEKNPGMTQSDWDALPVGDGTAATEAQTQGVFDKLVSTVNQARDWITETSFDQKVKDTKTALSKLVEAAKEKLATGVKLTQDEAKALQEKYEEWQANVVAAKQEQQVMSDVGQAFGLKLNAKNQETVEKALQGKIFDKAADDYPFTNLEALEAEGRVFDFGNGKIFVADEGSEIGKGFVKNLENNKISQQYRNELAALSDQIEAKKADIAAATQRLETAKTKEERAEIEKTIKTLKEELKNQEKFTGEVAKKALEHAENSLQEAKTELMRAEAARLNASKDVWTGLQSSGLTSDQQEMVRQALRDGTMIELPDDARPSEEFKAAMDKYNKNVATEVAAEAGVDKAEAEKEAAEAEVQKIDNPQANISEANGLDLVRMALEILAVTEAENDLSVQEEINVKSADVKDEIGEVEDTALAVDDMGEDASSASTVVGAASTVADLLSAAVVDLNLLSEDVEIEVPEVVKTYSAGGTTPMGSQTGPTPTAPETPQKEDEPEDTTDPISEAKRQEIERRRDELMGQYVNAAIQVAEGMNAISNKFLDRAAILAAFSGSVQTEAAAFGLAQDVGRYVLLETLRGVALSSIQMGVQATRLLKEQTVEVSNDKGE